MNLLTLMTMVVVVAAATACATVKLLARFCVCQKGAATSANPTVTTEPEGTQP